MSKILTGVKHIYFTPWNQADTALESGEGAKLELTNIIADTVAISQDDPDSSSIDCETRDEPIIESITLGKYQITMDSADIDYDILETCMGFSKLTASATTLGAAAPSSYVKKYVCVEVEMSDATFVLPRVLLTSKLDASSLKTDVAKGTLSGTAYSVSLKVGQADAVTTPFAVVNTNATYTVTKL